MTGLALLTSTKARIGGKQMMRRHLWGWGLGQDARLVEPGDNCRVWTALPDFLPRHFDMFSGGNKEFQFAKTSKQGHPRVSKVPKWSWPSP